MMRFFSRLRRQSEAAERPVSCVAEGGGGEQAVETDTTTDSPSSPRRPDSEGYPSWLPERPPPPAPASTLHSSTIALEAGSSTVPTAHVGGRKATPRSVRIVSLPDSAYGDERRVPTDHTRVASSGIMHPRVWSRATGRALSPTLLSTDPYLLKPRFNAPSLRLDIVRSNHPLVHVYFHFFRVFIFAHLLLQTFFDFNAIFILVQLSKYPTPEASGVPGSGRNWALGAAAYIACWFLQVFAVFIIYELVYSFVRRWRFKRPAIYPIYTSTPAFNFACVTSYSKFCFLQNLRYAAFKSSIRDGLAETFWYYSQNLPTVALLLPRAGLCLALLLSFSSPHVTSVALAATGVTLRDVTFFRDDGSLTGYSRGVLIANAAWTAWRALILIYSWLGLWIVSEQCCAGICGPQYRWQEEDFEKVMGARHEQRVDETQHTELLWSWRECTRERVQELFEFCLVASKYGTGYKERETSEDQRITEQVMAAVGLSPNAAVHASKRSVLTDDFFKGLPGEAGPSTERPVLDDKDAPLAALPYPFTTKGSAQVSSDDEKVPFPPSPSLPSEDEETSDEKKESSGNTGTGFDEDIDEEAEDEEEERLAKGSEEPSSGRASGSMSSLGHPVSSRYPFHFRRPPRGTSLNSSNSPISHVTPRSLQSKISRSTQSTGNKESTDSHSPRSHYTTTSEAASISPSSIISGAGIPMPPRHPNRGRAGTVPSGSAPSTPSPIDFPRTARRQPRGRADSGITQTFGAPQPRSDFDDDDDDVEDEPEVGDVIGLLSPSSQSSGMSPRGSFIHRSRTSTTSSSHPRSRANSHSGSSSSGARSRVESARSRAHSFIAAASRSSLELVRPRSHSMVRLEDDQYSSGHSRSGSGSASGGENWTFGHPAIWMRGGGDRREPPSPVQEEFRRGVQERRSPPSPVEERRESEEMRDEQDSESESESEGYGEKEEDEVVTSTIPAVIRASHSDLSLAPSVAPSTVHEQDETAHATAPVFIPPRRVEPTSSLGSEPDISTAAASFVTAAPTVEDATTTDESMRTIPSYAFMDHRTQGPGWSPA